MKTKNTIIRFGLIISLILSFSFSSLACTFSVELSDSYGDGWNGGLLTVNVNGTAVVTGATVASGYGPAIYTFTVNSGDLITTSYTAGSWSSENSYVIKDAGGTVIASDGIGAVTPSGISTAIVATCPSPNDLSLLSWETPSNGASPSATASIAVKVFNFGTVDQDTFNIAYSIDGGTTFITETYNDTLASGDTLTYTFTTTANMVTSGFYNCVAFVNNVGDANPSNDTLFYSPLICSPLAGAYTIGTGATDDFSDLVQMATALNTCGVAGPVTITVNAGTYFGQVELGFIAGSSPINTITITGLGDQTVFTASPTSGDRDILRLDGTKYLTIDSVKFEIQAGAAYGCCVRLMNAADSVTIENSILQTIISTSSYHNGILASTSKTSSASGGNTANYLTLNNNTIIGGYYGIRLNGNSTNLLERNVITNNSITDYRYYGINNYYADSSLISGNFISDGGTNSSPYGIYVYRNYAGTEISYNEIKMNGTSGGYGLYVYYNEGSSANNPIMIYNNMISQTNASATGSSYGIYSYYGKNVYFYHNSVSIAGGGTSSRAIYVNGSTTSTLFENIKLKNNIFVNYGNGYAFYMGGAYFPAKVTECDNNNLYSNGTYLAYYVGYKTTLTDWQAASIGLGLNSVSINPAFSALDDLHTSNIPMNNLGTPIASVTDDIDGDSRDALTPDIGADEYTPFNIDLAAKNVQGPLFYCGMTLDTIRVNIINQGVTTQSSYAVSYSLNNGLTFSTPEAITTTLISGDTLSYTFLTLADFTASGLYNIIATVTVVGDQSAANDTSAVYSFSNAIVSTLPFVEDFDANTDGSFGNIATSWIGSNASGLVWKAEIANTSSSTTGPLGPTGGSGAYIYLETSYGLLGEQDTLTKFCFDIPPTYQNVELSFDYHMYGATMGKLYTEIFDGSAWIVMDSIIGQQQLASSDPWLKKQFFVPSTTQGIRFIGERGSSYTGDMSIDNVTFKEITIDLVITEINYNGPEVGTDTTEFIEIYNAGIDAVNIDGFYFTQGVVDIFPNYVIQPGEYFVSAYDSTVMANFFGYIGASEWNSGGLSNGGEDIALRTSWGELVDSVNYDDGGAWPTQADGFGPSLVLCDATSDNNDATNWNVSLTYVDSINLLPVFASPGSLDNICTISDLELINPMSGDFNECYMTATETVSIEFVNNGSLDVPMGDTIYAYYQIDANSVVADTIIATSNIAPGDTIAFDFNQTADLSTIATYNWTVYLSYYNDLLTGNDTTMGTLTHYLPVVDLGQDTIYTNHPDTIVLDAGANYDLYTLSDGSTMQTLALTTAGTYYVDAVDTNGCSATDTVWVILPIYDLAITDPVNGMTYNNCNMTATEIIGFDLDNLIDPIYAPDMIYAFYQIDGGTIVADTIYINTDFATNSSMYFEFDVTFDFSALATYDWSMWVNYNGIGDTVSGQLVHYAPTVDLGGNVNDTLYITVDPYLYTLDAGAFDTYLWNDGSTMQTLDITADGWYSVIATDANGCDATDSVYVTNSIGINSNSFSNFNIYPNPNNGVFTIEANDNISIEIINIEGQVIYNDKFTSTKNTIDISRFTKGVYFIRVNSNNETRVEKIVVQ